MSAKDVVNALKQYADPARAMVSTRFFKTQKGEYGFGDIFIGVTMPQIRVTAKKYVALPLSDIRQLLQDPIHEIRMLGFIILTYQYAQAEEKGRQQIVDFYLRNIHRANNWDLVDASCYQILGAHLLYRARDLLFTLAASNNLWEQRVSIVSTFAFIRQGDVTTTMQLAKVHLYHPHDLMQKAVGWMLREVGKKDAQDLRAFLDQHASTMPRTMLRYAIEKFDNKTRQMYLQQ